MSNEVICFLREIACNLGYKVYNDVFGEIKLSDSVPIEQSSGAVYGIFVESNNKLKNVEPIPYLTNWYPVYWGADVTPPGRIKAHVQGHQNGNAKLQSVKEIQGKRLIYGAILVNKYKEFEKYLHEKFKPLLGKDRAGNKAKIIEIIN